MIQRFMDWRHGDGRSANEKEVKRQWKNNVCGLQVHGTLAYIAAQFLSFLIRMNDGELAVRVRSAYSCICVSRLNEGI